MADDREFEVIVKVLGEDFLSPVLNKINKSVDDFNKKYGSNVNDLKRQNKEIEDSFARMGKNIPPEQKKIIQANNEIIKSNENLEKQTEKTVNALNQKYAQLSQAAQKYNNNIIKLHKDYQNSLKENERVASETSDKQKRLTEDLINAQKRLDIIRAENHAAADVTEKDLLREANAVARVNELNRQRSVLNNKVASDTRNWNRDYEKYIANIERETSTLNRARKGFEDFAASAERDIRKLTGVFDDLHTSNTEVNRDNDLVQRGIVGIARAIDKFATGASRFGNISRSIFTPLAEGARDFQKNIEGAAAEGASTFEQIGTAASAVADNFAGLYVAASLVTTAVLGVAGALVALASSAVLAAGALGGALVAGVGEAIPVLGLLLAVAKQVKDVLDVFNLQQQQGQKGASTAQQAAQQARTSSRAIADAERGVADAHRQVADAQRNLDQAQKDLIKTREEALRQLKDLIAAEKSAQLQAEQSSLSLLSAQQRLQELVRTGGSAIDIRQAQLDIQAQRQGIADQQRQDAARRAQIQALQHPGQVVQGFESPVPAAQQQVAAARRQVAAAERQVADAQRQVARAGEDAAAGQAKLNATQSKLLTLTKQLTPAQKGLLAEIKRLFDPANGLIAKAVNPITDIIIRAITKALKTLEILFKDPKLRAAFLDLANSMAKSIEIFAKVLASPQMRRFFADFAKGAADTLPIIAKTFGDIILLFSRIAQAAMPLFKDLIGGFEGWTKKLADGAKDRDKLAGFFAIAGQHLHAWIDLGGAILRVLGAFVSGGAKTGLEIVQGITKEFNKWATWLNAHQNEVGKFFEQAKEVATDLWKVLVEISKTLFILFDPTLMKTFTDVLVLLLKLLDPILLLMKALIDPVLKVLNTLLDWVGAIVGLIKPITDFIGSLGDLKKVIKDVFIVVILGIPALLAKWGSDILSGLETAGNKIKGFFTGIAKWISNTWSDIWNGLSGPLTDAWHTVENFITGSIKTIVGFFTGFKNSLGKAWHDVWSGLESIASSLWNKVLGAVASFVNAIIDAVNWITQNILNILPGVDIGKISHWNPTAKATGQASSFSGEHGGGSGGVPQFAEGGLVQAVPGGVYRVAEAGHPESVIPLDPTKRDRALTIWKATGRMLGEPVRGSTPGFAGGGIVYPLAGTRGSIIGTPFAGTHDPRGRFKNWESDNAWDIGTARGTPAVAVRSGQIFGQDLSEPSYANSSSGTAGFSVHLRGGGEQFWYEHLSKVIPQAMNVAVGQIIGLTGTAANTNHLHWAAADAAGTLSAAVAHAVGDKYLRAPVASGSSALGGRATHLTGIPIGTGGFAGPDISGLAGGATSILGHAIHSVGQVIGMIKDKFLSMVPSFKGGGLIGNVFGGLAHAVLGRLEAIPGKVIGGVVNAVTGGAPAGSFNKKFLDQKGRAVGGTAFGGPNDPGTGSTGASGQNLYRHPWSYAELSTNLENGPGNNYNALGHLPMFYPMLVGNPATRKAMMLRKRDVGFGQGGKILPGGHRAAIDIWFEAARALGFGGYGPLLVAPGQGFKEGQLLHYAQGGIVPGPIGMPRHAIVHGGEAIIPSFASGAITGATSIPGSEPGGGRNPLERIFAAIAKGIEESGKKVSLALTKALTAFENYITKVTTKVTEAAARRDTATNAAAAGLSFGPGGQVTRGVPLSDIQVAERRLSDLKKDYDDLVSERSTYQQSLKKLQEELKKAKDPAVRQAIEGKINNIKALIKQNTQDLIDNVNAQEQAQQDLDTANQAHADAVTAHKAALAAQKLWNATHQLVNGVWTVLNDPIATVQAELDSLKDQASDLATQRQGLVAKLSDLETKRKEALDKYGPDSPQVKAIDAKIDDLNKLMDDNAQAQEDNIDAQIAAQQKIAQIVQDNTQKMFDAINNSVSRASNLINVIGQVLQAGGASADAASAWVRAAMIAVIKRAINALIATARRLGIRVAPEILAVLAKLGFDVTGIAVGDPIGVNVPFASGGHVPNKQGGTPIIVGEGGYDEYVLTTDPKHRNRNMGLASEYLSRMGIKGYAAGGIPPNDTGGNGGPGDTGNTTPPATIWYVPSAVWSGWTPAQRTDWVYGVVATFGEDAAPGGIASWNGFGQHWSWATDHWAANEDFAAYGIHKATIDSSGKLVGGGTPISDTLPKLPEGQTGTYGVQAPNGGTGNQTSTEGSWESQVVGLLGQIAGLLSDGGAGAGPTDHPDPIQEALDKLNKKYDQQIGLVDQQIQIDELNGDKADELIQLQKKAQLLQAKGVELQDLLAKTQVGSDQWYAIMAAINDNTIAQLTNTKAINDLNNNTADTGPQNWASRTWQWFRVAVFNGLGSLLPQFTPPSDVASGGAPPAASLSAPSAPTYGTPRAFTMGTATGGIGSSTYLDDTGGGKWGDMGWKGRKTGSGAGGDVNVFIEHPIENADPVYIGHRIIWGIQNSPMGGKVSSR